MLNISFLGDISLNDDYVGLYNKGINPFKDLESPLFSSDFVAGNLECMAAGSKGENLLKQPRLTTSSATLNYLKKINLKVAFLAHNHVYDHLESGFIKTTEFLTNNDIDFLGAGHTLKDACKPKVLTKGLISVALLNYVTSDTNPNIPETADICLNIFNLDKAIQDIHRLKGTVNHIILSIHWGGRVEGGHYPDWDQPKIAHRIIDAGADLIIGHHSHTIQPFEVYKGKFIFYSLGNFCFSDYRFNGLLHPMPKRRMITEIVNISFDSTNYRVQTHFYLNKLLGFKQLNSYKHTLLFRNIVFKIFLSNKPGWKVYFFHKQFILPGFQFFNRKDLSFIEKSIRTLRYIKKRIV
jgi:hypothetical protein